MIDCRVSFENILDSLDYVIDLPASRHFTSNSPVERSVLLAPDFISSNIFRRTSFALSLIQVLYLVTSRYIPSVSYVGSRYYVLARFIRRHFMVLGFYHFIPSGYYDVLLVFRAFIEPIFSRFSCISLVSSHDHSILENISHFHWISWYFFPGSRRVIAVTTAAG